MTNTLVGDVYQKIIEEVVNASTADFEESGISQGTLQALREEWQAKLSQRSIAHMPWDPKPVVQPPPPMQTNAAPSSSSNGVTQPPPSSSYNAYDNQASSAPANGATKPIKTEPGTEASPNAAQNGYSQPNVPPPQGGLARAQQLIQNQYGNAANASLNSMPRGGGLALPGQQQPAQGTPKPQGLQLPQQSQSPNQQQPQIKTENESPQLAQQGFQQAALPNYSQTDGADDADDVDAMSQWKAMLAERRAISDENRQQADHMMRDHVVQLSAGLQSGLMVPLEEHRTARQLSRNAPVASSSRTPGSSTLPTIPQLDGELDDDDEDVKADIKDEDDENAINSDLDDPESDGGGAGGEDDEEWGDEILCTYDKVQRVKNKWKCTLKDGIMSAGGKDWVFHKGTGEFEW